jgi:hypothetical protein
MPTINPHPKLEIFIVVSPCLANFQRRDSFGIAAPFSGAEPAAKQTRGPVRVSSNSAAPPLRERHSFHGERQPGRQNDGAGHHGVTFHRTLKAATRLDEVIE